jgi:G3E family GTPase
MTVKVISIMTETSSIPNRTAVAPAVPLIPVTVITGFLGSGKTTLLNRLVRQPDMAGAAVIINEFGDIGIDHLLVERIAGEAVLLDSGCLCCAVRGDLVDTMSRMAWQADHGELPAFDRLVVETTGLADPAPVLQTLMSDRVLTARYRLAGMVTTIDAVNGAVQIDAHAEALKQVALASRLLVTKTDLVSPAALDGLERALRALNPSAPMQAVAHGAIGSDLIIGDYDYDPSVAGDAAAWLGAGEYHDHIHTQDHAHAHAHTHDHNIDSFCLTRTEPVPWGALSDWLRSLTSLRGADLLRVKGIVNVAGRDRPAVLHGVQHIFHAPRLLERWPDRDRRTRIVCITRGLREADVSNALDAAIENLRD